MFPGQLVWISLFDMLYPVSVHGAASGISKITIIIFIYICLLAFVQF